MKSATNKPTHVTRGNVLDDRYSYLLWSQLFQASQLTSSVPNPIPAIDGLAAAFSSLSKRISYIHERRLIERAL